jgi:hypothetical protein
MESSDGGHGTMQMDHSKMQPDHDHTQH